MGWLIKAGRETNRNVAIPAFIKLYDSRSHNLLTQRRIYNIFRALQNLTIFVAPMKGVDFSEVTGVRALSFRNLSVGETAGPDMSGQCGGGKTPS